MGRTADVSSVSAVGGLVCETELHLSKCLMKLGSELTGAAVWGGGSGKNFWGVFSLTSLSPSSGTSWLKAMKTSSLWTF